MSIKDELLKLVGDLMMSAWNDGRDGRNGPNSPATLRDRDAVAEALAAQHADARGGGDDKGLRDALVRARQHALSEGWDGDVERLENMLRASPEPPTAAEATSYSIDDLVSRMTPENGQPLLSSERADLSNATDAGREDAPVVESGWYGEIASPQDAIYEKAAAMDNQDVPLEQWPDKLIEAMARAGYAVVPVALPHTLLGEAAIAGVFETGNPKHGWDYLLSKARAYPRPAGLVLDVEG